MNNITLIKRRYIISIMLFLILSSTNFAQSTPTNFNAGACVIDMGIIPQTANNGLRPYGLIQELVSVHEIPVYWIIDDTKSFVSATGKVDQTDLTVTGTINSNPASTGITVDLKSGPFLIPAEFMVDAQAVIESWIATSTGAGTDKLTVYWNLDAITAAPVHGTLYSFPTVSIYPVGGDVASPLPTDVETAFYTPAGITTGFTKTAPKDIGTCDQIYVLSHHTDPDTDWDQADINAFYDFVIDGGNVWLGCHDVSLTENVLTTTSDASNPTRGVNQLNFLSNSGLIPYSDLLNVSTNYPWLTDYADGFDQILEHDNTFINTNINYDITTASDPFMQFMGNVHPALNGNSEHIYVPLDDVGGSTGGWRSTTTVSVYDPSNTQIPTRSKGRAGPIVYGPAYGNTAYGTVLYQGSHISKGNNVANFAPEHIAELRIFGNFLLESVLETSPQITVPELPPITISCGDSLIVNATVDGEPYPNNTYLWEYEVISGTTTAPVTFTPNNAATTTIYFPSNVGEVVFKITLTFTSTPDGGCSNPVIAKYISVVTVNEATTSNAGPDQILNASNCGITSLLMAATNTAGYTGTWSIISGTGGSFADINDANTIFTGLASTSYVLRWSITCAEDDVQISFANNCSNLDFDGVNDNITFDDNYNFSGAFSIELWIKPSSLSGTQSIISKRDANNLTTGYDLKLVNSTLSFNWNSSGSLSSPYPLGTNRWYHIAVTFDNTTYLLYIDGVEINSSSGVVPTNNNFECIVGAMDQNITSTLDPINYFNGWLDELRIWNVALTEAQIRQMMNQEIGANDDSVIGSIAPIEIPGLNWNSDLTAYYQMNQSTDISNGNIIEYTGNTITGKLRNITTSQAESTPLPYTTKADGAWNDDSASTPWTYGNSVWNIPNSLSVDGFTVIDWNIVQTNHNITIDTYANLGRERSVLGLIVGSNELQVNGDTASGTGNGLTVTHYLKLDGTLDLEGESQLIQSANSDLDVTSSGVLERDQQGTADLYTYNYWAAPVGISNTTSNNNSYTLPDILYDGTTPIATPSAPPKPINFLLSGYNGTTGDPISIADYWVWKFSNQLSDDYASWQHVRSTGSLSPGEGYTMKGVTDTGGAISNEQNYVFNGKPHNGHVTLTLSAGNDYLVGNPYASAIDADEFIKDNISVGNGGRAATNIINGTLYFWEHFASSTHNLGEYQGGYGTYTLMGGVTAISNDVRINNSGALGTKTPKQYIPVGQGFFVTAATGGTVSFKNSQRIFKTEASDPSVFMKANSGKQKNSVASSTNANTNLITDTRPKIRFILDSPKGYHRQLLLGADLNASDSYDIGYDALLIEDNKEDMFWVFDNNNFIIQAVDNFSDNNVFPLGVIINQAGMTTIKIDALENIPESIDIFVYDKELNIFHDLNLYPYNINLPIGEYLNKFEIVLHNKSLSTKDKYLTGVDINYANAIKSIIITNLNHSNINVIRMTNLLGQEVFSTKDYGSKNYCEIKTKPFSSGTYILTVVTDKGTVIKKVIVE